MIKTFHFGVSGTTLCRRAVLGAYFLGACMGGNPASADTPSWDGLSGSALVGRTFGHVQEKGGYWDEAPTPYPNLSIGTDGDGLNAYNGNIKLNYDKDFNDNVLGIELGGTWQSTISRGDAASGYAALDCMSSCSGLDNTLKASTKVNTYETFSARAGHVFNNTTLLYVSGGGAVGQAERTLFQTGSFSDWFDPGTRISNDKNIIGYALGFGVEHRLSDHWSLRADYQYVDFNNVKFTSVGPYTTMSTTSSFLRQSTPIYFSNLMCGVTYHF